MVGGVSDRLEKIFLGFRIKIPFLLISVNSDDVITYENICLTLIYLKGLINKCLIILYKK